MAASWEKNLRRLIKDTHGQGWSLRQKGLGTTQVTRRWSDNSRSSATVRIPWKRSTGPKLLALIERLAIAIAPEAEGGQGLTLARAAELIQLEDEGVSVQTIRSGSVDWLAVADRYRHHRVEVTGAITARPGTVITAGSALRCWKSLGVRERLRTLQLFWPS